MKKIKILALISTLMISRIASADLNTGLVAHWNFDDCAVNDNSGNNYNGVIQGNPECVNGISGKALKLNESNKDYVLVNNDIKLNIPNYTISAWYKIEKPVGSWDIIISRMLNSTTTWVDAWDLTLSSDNKVYYWYYDSSQKNSIYCCSKLGKWNFVSVVVSGGNGQIFLNGNAVTKFTTNTLSSAENLPICIGCNDFNGSTPTHYFNGTLDEIRIYNRALNVSEVTELYNVGLSVGGTVKSLATHTVSCKNETTGQIVNIASNKATAYDCEANGLKVNTGETASIFIKGVVQ